jgi:hypothetical protein
MTWVEGRLAVIWARSGDLARARAGMDQVERAVEARGGRVDSDRWASFMRAELAWLDGDYAGAAACCGAVRNAIAGHETRWWQSLRAQVKARLALAVLRQGDAARGRLLLTEAIAAAESWCEHPALAAVLDATATYVLTRTTDPVAAALAARLLGAAHAIRGAFDESSLDAPQTRKRARQTLGAQAFDTAYASTANLTYPEGVALARESLTQKPFIEHTSK